MYLALEMSTGSPSRDHRWTCVHTASWTEPAPSEAGTLARDDEVEVLRMTQPQVSLHRTLRKTALAIS